MSKLKKITAGFLCLALTLAMTACTEGSGSGSGTTTTTIDDDILNPVDVDDIDLGLDTDADIEGTVIKYIGTYDPTKAGDVKPAYVYFKNTYGATMEVELHTDAEIMDKLAALIQAGDSPDLVDQRSNSFPYYMTQNTYMALDDYMDMDAPQWADVVDYIDSYAVNGKHYYYPWAYYVSPYFMIYNRAKFAELGIDDPKELYDANEWTWDTFKSCMEAFVTKTQSDIPDVVGVYGTVASAFIDTTGVPLVGYENGQLVNNLNSADVDRAQVFLEELKKQGLSSLTYADYSNVDQNPVILGYAAFHAVGDWKIADYCQVQAQDESIDIFFVPFPRDPNADNYYYKLDTFAYLVPAGAQNVEAACIFINCVRLSKTDSELQEKTKTSIITQKAYTDEQYEFWNYFQTVENFSSDCLVRDYSYALDTQTCEDVVIKICEDIPFTDNEDTQSWAVTRTTYEGLLQNSIDNINKGLTPS